LSNDNYRLQFLQAAADWVCDSYSIDIRYVVRHDDNQSQLWAASIALAPLPFSADMSFHINTPLISAGQYQLSNQKKRKIIHILENAAQGKIEAYGSSFHLKHDQLYDYNSEMTHHDRWFSDLHLQVIGSLSPLPGPLDLAVMNNALRRGNPPFDGLTDITGWLGLKYPYEAFNQPSIEVRVGPPVDLIFPSCKLEDDQLTLTLHAHPRFDTSRINLAARGVPGIALEARKQVAQEIEWKRVRDGRREGTAVIQLSRADSALAMLMIGDSTVRKQWFLDPVKARNKGLIAIQHFDKDLRMIKQAVLEPSSAERFERGIAALLFLLGFTPALQIETDSPDIVVTTPGGKLAIGECTTKIADFHNKLGKLVDRRRALSRSLQISDHYFRVDAALVCASPRDQIAISANELEAHQIILITKEDLIKAFDRLRFPSNPDEILDKAVAKLIEGNNLATA